MKKGIASLVLVLFMPLMAFAEGPAITALTDDNVQRFVAALQDIEKWSAKYDAEEFDFPEDNGKGFSAENMQAMAHEWLAKNEGTVQASEFESLISKHGFSDVNEYIGVMSSVMSAFVSSKMEEHNVDMEAQVAQARAAVENNPSISPEMRDQLLAQMNKSVSMVKGMEANTTPENIAVVKRNASLIEGAMQ